jgi:hypothetical protein
MTRVPFEAMSAVRDRLDFQLVTGRMEYGEWIELVEALGWSDDDLLEEISKRWDAQTLN